MGRREHFLIDVEHLSHFRSGEFGVPVGDLETGWENRQKGGSDTEKDSPAVQDALTEDVRKRGVVKPVKLQKVIHPDGTAEDVLADGSHRVLAAQRAGVKKVPARWKRPRPYAG